MSVQLEDTRSPTWKHSPVHLRPPPIPHEADDSLGHSAKSTDLHAQPLIAYCTKVNISYHRSFQLSVKEDPVLSKLRAETNKRSDVMGLGAPEVYQLGQNLIRLIKGKRVLDIGKNTQKRFPGTLSGGSALAWALVLPEDGEVISMDVDHGILNEIGRPVISRHPNIARKIDFRLAPALEMLGDPFEILRAGRQADC